MDARQRPGFHLKAAQVPLQMLKDDPTNQVRG